MGGVCPAGLDPLTLLPSFASKRCTLRQADHGVTQREMPDSSAGGVLLPGLAFAHE